MGMTATFRRLPEADLERLREDPELVADYLGEDEPSGGFGPFAELDVDKAWHAIHFLLTGSAWEGDAPLNFIVAGGTGIGDNGDDGATRWLDSAEVVALATALDKIPTSTLMERFEPAALSAAGIYPEIWDRPLEEDDTRSYVAEYYEMLRSFILGAASQREALLIALA
jgi:hypothetical protein